MIKQFIFRFKWLMYKIQEQGEQAVATMMDVKDLLEWFYEIIIKQKLNISESLP